MVAVRAHLNNSPESSETASLRLGALTVSNFLKVLAAVLALATISVAGCTTIETSHHKTLDHGPAQRNSVPLDYLPALKGDYFEIDSKLVGRKYHIYTRLPEGYEGDTTERYPVVYLLDGDSLFPLLSPTHLFLTYDEQLPEAIIIGISYGEFNQSINKRHIDFSAPAPDAAPGENGAPQFLGFLKNELIPAVEGRYRVNSDKRVLLGQSRGGYFVLWSALQAPDLFWGRIASNPSLTPGRESFLALLPVIEGMILASPLQAAPVILSNVNAMPKSGLRLGRAAKMLLGKSSIYLFKTALMPLLLVRCTDRQCYGSSRTRSEQRKGRSECAAGPNSSFKPKPLRGWAISIYRVTACGRRRTSS